MATTKNTTDKRILVHDGAEIFEAFKGYLYTLKDATIELVAAFDDISEFHEPLDRVTLIEIYKDPTTYFDKLSFDSKKWVNTQRPILRDALFNTSEDLVNSAREAYNRWSTIYRNVPVVSNRQVPQVACQLTTLEGLFNEEGFTKEWLDSKKHLFDEYLETPAELAFYEALEKLATAATEVTKYARHWQHALNPMIFLEHNESSKSFKPKTEIIKNYVATYTPEPEEVVISDPKINAREALQQFLYDKAGLYGSTDEELIRAEINGETLQDANMREAQSILRG